MNCKSCGAQAVFLRRVHSITPNDGRLPERFNGEALVDTYRDDYDCPACGKRTCISQWVKDDEELVSTEDK